jgi:hypothetical protein
MSQYITWRVYRCEHAKAVNITIIMYGDSKLLSGFSFIDHEIPDNNLESLCILDYDEVESSMYDTNVSWESNAFVI